MVYVALLTRMYHLLPICRRSCRSTMVLVSHHISSFLSLEAPSLRLDYSRSPAFAPVMTKVAPVPMLSNVKGRMEPGWTVLPMRPVAQVGVYRGATTKSYLRRASAVIALHFTFQTLVGLNDVHVLGCAIRWLHYDPNCLCANYCVGLLTLFLQ
ncbi:hypothetical protein VTK73DRAFT_4393 [Phialemonium thermophilum]|uniref:Secreted protein n=1 Tax=Phialemonium thermophilum TaxID=223376 RepID=A0ABR3XZD0_9PEZI